MYYINKIVLGLANPMTVGLLLMLVALIAGVARRRGMALVVGLAAFAWFLCSSHPMLVSRIARQVERRYPPVTDESFPRADAIVLLGGGLHKGEGETIYPELHDAADRVWLAARLWKAGKAPLIYTTGMNEAFATSLLMKDLGVPESAIRLEPLARNTEENAKYIVEQLLATDHINLQPPSQLTILLVTSPWHMRRSLLMFERAFAKAAPRLSVRIIPAAADYEALNDKDEFTVNTIFPSASYLKECEKLVKEFVGYHGYKWVRK